MEDLLAKLKAGAAAVRRVRLPRKEGEGPEAGLRILSEGDYLAAGLAALETLRAAGHADANVSNADLFELSRTSELLARAVVDPDTLRPAAKNAAALRAALTRADQAYLIEQYLDLEREYSPSETNMDEAAFGALLTEVKKNPGTPRLNDFSTATLKRLVQSLAAPQPS